VTPLGLNHFVSEDDEYKGFKIPKGTLSPSWIRSITKSEKERPSFRMFGQYFTTRKLHIVSYTIIS